MSLSKRIKENFDLKEAFNDLMTKAENYLFEEGTCPDVLDGENTCRNYGINCLYCDLVDAVEEIKFLRG